MCAPIRPTWCSEGLGGRVEGADEVVGFLQTVKGTRNRVAVTTTYAVGLRATQAARLQVTDIDSSRMVIRIEQGKGARTTM